MPQVVVPVAVAFAAWLGLLGFASLARVRNPSGWKSEGWWGRHVSLAEMLDKRVFRGQDSRLSLIQISVVALAFVVVFVLPPVRP